MVRAEAGAGDEEQGLPATVQVEDAPDGFRLSPVGLFHRPPRRKQMATRRLEGHARQPATRVSHPHQAT